MGAKRLHVDSIKVKILMLGLILSTMTVLSACRGPQGPTGPTGPIGPAGPGSQITYVFSVSPTDSSGVYEAVCPAVVVDNINGEYSTVSCYLHFDGYDDAPLVPYTDTETGGSTTNYFYSIDDGIVTLGWVNSAATTPESFELVVTVVN